MPIRYVMSRKIKALKDEIVLKKDELVQKENELVQKDAIIQQKEDEIVREKAFRYTDPHLKFWYIFYLLSKMSLLFICIAIVVLSNVIGLLVDKVSFLLSISIITIIGTVLTKMFDKVISRHTSTLRKALLSKALKSLEKLIKCKEGLYADKIIEYIKENDLLSKGL